MDCSHISWHEGNCESVPLELLCFSSLLIPSWSLLQVGVRQHHPHPCVCQRGRITEGELTWVVKVVQNRVTFIFLSMNCRMSSELLSQLFNSWHCVLWGWLWLFSFIFVFTPLYVFSSRTDVLNARKKNVVKFSSFDLNDPGAVGDDGTHFLSPSFCLQLPRPVPWPGQCPHGALLALGYVLAAALWNGD